MPISHRHILCKIIAEFYAFYLNIFTAICTYCHTKGSDCHVKREKNSNIKKDADRR